MRIPSGVTDQYIYFVCTDATDFTTRETGLTGFTVKRSRNGGTLAAMTTPTIVELESASAPGVYALLLDEDMTIGSGNDSEEMVFHIAHASIAPVTRTIELYRPKITAGATLSTATVDTIASDLVQVYSDTTVIASDLVVAASDVVQIYSDTTVIASDLVIAASDVIVNTDKLEGISSGSAGALNFANEADNIDSSIKSVSFVGVETSGTNASVNAEDGTYHQIDDTTNAIDIVYQFDVGGGRTATGMTFKGYLNGGNDEMTVQAYNGSGWDQVFTIDGKSGSTNDVEEIPLLSTHTGTGSDLGKVFIRIQNTGQSNPTLYVDQLIVQAVNIGQSVGYALGAIWVDTTNGTAGTEAFVNGTADNPVDSWADALTLSSSTGLLRFHLAAASSITLDADSTGCEFLGEAWTLAFGGQTITGCYISGATVSGTYVGSTAILDNCIINAITGPGITMRNCYLNEVTITNNGTAGWYLNDCRSRIAGTGYATFDYGVGVGNTGLSVREYSGGIELQNLGDTGTDTASVEGNGHVILNANCDGGEMALRGNLRLTDNSGNVKVVSNVPTITQLHQGQAQGGGTTTITLQSDASSTDGAYDPGIVSIVAGTGIGQSRLIIDYVGSTKVATVDRDWRTNPDSTSSYIVSPSAALTHVNEGAAAGGAASTITLNSAATATDDIYNGQTVFLTGGTGQDQARVITDYVGSTKVATVHRAWETQPDTTTSYQILPLPSNGDTVATIASDLVQVYSDTTIVVSDTTAIHTQTTTATSDLVIVASDLLQVYSDTTIIASDVVQVYSDTTILVSDTTAIHTQTTTIASDVVEVYSDTTVISSDTAAIESAGGSLSVAQDSKLTKVTSDVVIIGSDVVEIYSDTTVISSDTAAIEAGGGSLTAAQSSKLTKVTSDVVIIGSDVVEIYSDTTVISSDTAAIESAGGSLTAAQSSKLTKVTSDVVIVVSDTTAIHTQTTTIASDLVIVASDLAQVYSDTTIVVSDTTAIHTTVTTAASDLVIVASDLLQVYSDTTVIASDVVQVYSDTTIVVSDTTAIHTQTTTATSDLVIIASDLAQVYSDTTIVVSDTIAIHTTVTTAASDLVIVASDLLQVYSDTTIIVSDTTAIGVQATTIASDLVLVYSDTTVIASDVALIETTRAEPGQGAPGATISPLEKIDWLFKAFRNKSTQDATTYELYNDAGTTVDHKATVSDDGSDFTRGEIVTGP